MSKNKTVVYSEYLELDTLLSCQKPVSSDAGISAHDEMLFIIIHQAYELWFKQILFELSSVIEMFDRNFVDEKNIGVAVARLERIREIEKLMIQQIDVLETMTPLDFLDFRHLLTGASGFQSSQFRLIEIMLGLRTADRLSYSSKPYYAEFPANERERVLKSQEQATLFSVLEKWLERTPFLSVRDFSFLEAYRNAFRQRIAAERAEVEESGLFTPEEQQSRLKMIAGTEEYVLSILERKNYEIYQNEGKVRFSYPAFLAALFINLYRDQPILHMPFRLLSSVLEVDEFLNLWRHRHVLMVHRMIGSKMGTGGSSGHDYLRATVDRHRVFVDLYNLSTLLIPRSELPVLPEEMISRLGFYYTTVSGA